MTGRVVRDSDGKRYILEKESGESSRVRDPETGERLHLPNAELEPVEGASPLRVAAGTLPKEVVTLVTGVPDGRALGLLVELDARGPTRVRTLLDATALCESDLHGLLAALQAADLLSEVTVAGERGYETTETASAALDRPAVTARTAIAPSFKPARGRPSTMHLTESTWTDAAALETDIAVLPVGSTEQHGPHAPLGTDALAAEVVAAEGAERAHPEVAVAPTVPVGVAAEHRQFAGSLWVSEDTFRAYVGETVESLASHGWTRVVVVNGHGGNAAPLREVCGGLTRDGPAYAVAFTWFDAVDIDEVEFEGAMGHGGPIETSLLQHVRPELVHESRFEAAAAGAADGWGEWQAGVNLAYDTAEFTESGVVGDPGEGSAALGERLYDLASDRLAALIEVVATRDVSRPRSPKG